MAGRVPRIENTPFLFSRVFNFFNYLFHLLITLLMLIYRYLLITFFVFDTILGRWNAIVMIWATNLLKHKYYQVTYVIDFKIYTDSFLTMEMFYKLRQLYILATVRLFREYEILMKHISSSSIFMYIFSYSKLSLKWFLSRTSPFPTLLS